MKALQKRAPWMALLGGFLISGALAWSSPAWQEEGGEGGDSAAQATEEEEEGDRWYAVTGGDIYTGTGAILKGATLLSHNGKIREVGYNVVVPENAEVLDATGYRVYPGLVAIASSSLFGTGGDLENSVDPFSEAMLLGLSTGITSAVQGSELGKLKRGSIENVVLSKNFFHSIRFGSSNPAGKKDLREKFEGAARYIREKKAWDQNPSKDKGPEPKRAGIDMGLVGVLTGERLATFFENQRGDLLEIARLAQRFGFRPVIQGGVEAWTVADELGRAGATVILTPRDRTPKSETLVRDGGSSIENAAILHSHGVSVAIRTPGQGISIFGVSPVLTSSPCQVSAAFAMRGGLSGRPPSRLITIVPARLAGVSHRIGTLEVGKDADFIVTDGDLMHYATFVQWAVVEGKMVYDKQAEMYFAHIRPRPEADWPPPKRWTRAKGRRKKPARNLPRRAKRPPREKGTSPRTRAARASNPAGPQVEPGARSRIPRTGLRPFLAGGGPQSGPGSGTVGKAPTGFGPPWACRDFGRSRYASEAYDLGCPGTQEPGSCG
ncbi:MAG: amidohydrolase family protein [Planctomycetota bacterium]